jgi:hypothetical protein
MLFVPLTESEAMVANDAVPYNKLFFAVKPVDAPYT